MIEADALVKLDTRIVDKPWGRRGIDPRFGVEPRRARSARSGSSRRRGATST